MIDIRNMSKGERVAVDCNFCLEIPSAYSVINSPVDVKVNGEIIKAGERFFAKCRCSAEIVLECALCLEPVSVFLDFELDEIFSETKTGEEIWQIEDRKIDLKPAIESDLYSLIPMKQLCSDDCRGIKYLEENEGGI